MRHTEYAIYCYDRSNPWAAVWNRVSLDPANTTLVLGRTVEVPLVPVFLLVVGLHAFVDLDSRLVLDQRFRRQASLHI